MIRKTMTAVGLGALCALLAACGSRSDDQSATPGGVPGTYSAPTVSTPTPATATPSSLSCPGATQDADGKFVCPTETTAAEQPYGTATVTLTSKQGYKARIDVKVSAPEKVTDLVSIGDSANPCNNIIGETNSHSVGYTVHVETITTDITGNGFDWDIDVPFTNPGVNAIAYDPLHSAVEQPIRGRVLCSSNALNGVPAKFGPNDWTLAVWDTATPTHKVDAAAVRNAALWMAQIGIQGADCVPELQGGGSHKTSLSPKARWNLMNACKFGLVGVEPNLD
ncbi:hypothetical protein AB0L70_06960 [Kribbella sp. NPDC051952]|uniref:hypothetical protein n=1 Tax=Kribbella sp. NPDC051952 TaxID=3154851 RepID=UPI00342C9348